MINLQQVRVEIENLGKPDWKTFTMAQTKAPVAVYQICISEFLPKLNFLAGLLSPGETLRAARYHQQKDRLRFIISRGLLRIIVGKYLQENAADVRFVVSANKKPRLDSPISLHFNVSHSGDCVLVAISTTETGVDVEQTDHQMDFSEIIPGNFSAGEAVYVGSGAGAWERFYQLWTRKEALVKATSKGIDEGFSEIPSLAGLHLVDPEIIGSENNWTVAAFEPGKGYLAAIAYSAKETIQNICFSCLDPSFLED